MTDHTFYDTLRDNNPDLCCSSFIRNRRIEHHASRAAGIPQDKEIHPDLRQTRRQGEHQEDPLQARGTPGVPPVAPGGAREGVFGGGGRSTLEILESKHVISILMYLDEMSPVLKSDIYNNISRSATMAEKIEDLRKIGLVDVYWTAKANTNVVVITDKGRKIAGMFREILDLVGNDE